MADVFNILAEDHRNILDDDAVPTLRLSNTHASGVGAWVENTNASGGLALNVDSTAGLGVDVDAGGVGVDVDVSGSDEAINALSAGGEALVARSQATEAHVLDIALDTAVSSPTVGLVRMTNSAASGVMFEFSGGLISTASLAGGSGVDSTHAGAIPVKLVGEDKVVYLMTYEIA